MKRIAFSLAALLMLLMTARAVGAQGLSIGSGATFSLGASTLTLGGNWSNAGAFSAGSGTVIFNGDSPQTITGSNTFYDLVIEKDNAIDTVDASGSTLAVTHKLSVARGVFTSASAFQDVEIAGPGTLELSADITVSGKWENLGGTFTPNNHTVTLNGAGQSVIGDTTFYNLTKQVAAADTLTFEAGSTTTIANTLTLQGGDGQLLSLRSSTTDTRWKIDPQGTRTVAYLDVKDSENINAADIDALGKHCADSGNNIKWLFKAALTMAVSPAGAGVTTPDAGSTTNIEAGVAQDITALAGTGYDFVNWTADPSGNATFGNGASESTTVTLIDSATVTANFALKTYAVTYNGNGGTSGTAPGAQTKTYGVDLTLASNTGNLARTGYAFSGWNTAADGSGANYAAGGTYTANAALALYAKWTANTYTVTFNPNGGTIPSPATKQVTYGSTYGVLATTTREGYAFNGWFTAAMGGTQVTSGTTMTIASNHTLYAQWTINTYTLTTAANPGAGGTVTRTPDKANYDHGENVQISAAANAGYRFTGWSGDLSGTNNPATLTMDGNKNITANFAATYTVTYHANGATSGTAPAPQTKTHDVALTLATNGGNLARTGYTFSGWNTAADGSGTTYAAGGTYTANAAMTLYARWTQEPTFTVTYNGNGNTGGSVPADGNAYQEGDTVTVLGNTGNLEKTGSTFAAWNTTADGSGTSYAPGTQFNMPGANVTLYAQWESQCAAIINPENAQRSPDAANDLTTDVIIPAGCDWTAVANANWIVITGGASGTGDGSVTYRISENTYPNLPRTGTISIAAQTCTITQGSYHSMFTDGPGNGCEMEIEREVGGPYFLYMNSQAAGGTLPPDTTFPWGLFDFKVVNVPLGGTVRITFRMTFEIPAGSIFYHYYSDTDTYTPYTNVEGLDDGDNEFTLILTDGGDGDKDGAVNGEIVDPGGVGMQGQPIPVLSEWAMMILISLLAGITLWRLRRETM